ncbi:MAG: YtxH protein [Microbacteriaceae bacterium]|nr:YtxH protein [Microbacteriaceae bacterium]
MKGKILLLVGVGIGYVLGTRAGREKYDEIKAAVDRLWNDPRVQRQVNQAEDFVKDKGPEVAEFLADGAKKVVAQVSGSKAPTRRPAARTTPAKPPAPPTPVKPAASAPPTSKPSS